MIPVVYNHHQILANSDSLPPGAFKARDVFSLIKPDGLKHVQDFGPVDRAQLKVIHDPLYVDDVIMGRISNGFGTRNPDHTVSILFTVANMMAAANQVLLYQEPVVYSLSNGFHHAGWAHGGGYCTFNALILAAERLSEELKGSVLILDGDAHFGDGCVDILSCSAFKNSSTVYRHVGQQTPGYETQLEQITNEILNNEYVAVIYQPGADSYLPDKLGHGTFSRKAFRERDLEVFTACRSSKTPIIFNLAGGYGAPRYFHTLMMHYSTWESANEVFTK